MKEEEFNRVQTHDLVEGRVGSNLCATAIGLVRKEI